MRKSTQALLDHYQSKPIQKKKRRQNTGGQEKGRKLPSQEVSPSESKGGGVLTEPSIFKERAVPILKESLKEQKSQETDKENIDEKALLQEKINALTRDLRQKDLEVKDLQEILAESQRFNENNIALVEKLVKDKENRVNQLKDLSQKVALIEAKHIELKEKYIQKLKHKCNFTKIQGTHKAEIKSLKKFYHETIKNTTECVQDYYRNLNYQESSGRIQRELEIERKRNLELNQEVLAMREALMNRDHPHNNRHIEQMRKQVLMLKSRHEARLAEISRQETEEIEAIEMKVKQTIKNRDEKIKELQEQLQNTQMQKQAAEDVLEHNNK